MKKDVFAGDMIMALHDLLTGDVLDWLLEKDDSGIAYLVLRDLLDLQPDNHKLCAARVEAHAKGPIANVLATLVDVVVCVLTPKRLRGVGQFYRHFEPVTDEQVLDLLYSNQCQAIIGANE